MTEVPYRDLGSGFVRLGASELSRRMVSPLKACEEVLAALLDNSVRAGAKNIYVASSLRARRFRTLTVIDDGSGIPENHAAAIFEPGVTTRPSSASAGMSLHHIKAVAIETSLVNLANPTAFRVTLDTASIPEKTVQSRTPDASQPANLYTTALRFAMPADGATAPQIHYSSPSEILATLLRSHIIQQTGERREDDNPPSSSDLAEWGRSVGLEVSGKTAKRILSGDISASEPLDAGSVEARSEKPKTTREPGVDSAISLVLDERETAAIADILDEAARKTYLSIGEIEVRSGAGEISLHARLFEREDEYG